MPFSGSCSTSNYAKLCSRQPYSAECKDFKDSCKDFLDEETKNCSWVAHDQKCHLQPNSGVCEEFKKKCTLTPTPTRTKLTNTGKIVLIVLLVLVGLIFVGAIGAWYYTKKEYQEWYRNVGQRIQRPPE